MQASFKPFGNGVFSVHALFWDISGKDRIYWSAYYTALGYVYAFTMISNK